MKFNLMFGLVLMAAWIACPAGSVCAVELPGVRKMAGRLQEIIRTEDPMINTFRNKERAAIMGKALSAETNPARVWEMLPRMAEEQLRAGRPKDALESYRLFEETSVKMGRQLDARSIQMVAHQRAVSNLRLGEQ